MHPVPCVVPRKSWKLDLIPSSGERFGRPLLSWVRLWFGTTVSEVEDFVHLKLLQQVRRELTWVSGGLVAPFLNLASRSG
jgi:hypothetical protein